MSVIERAEKRLNDEIRQHELGLDNVDDIQYWAAYLDGARAQKKDAAAAIEALQAEVERLQADVEKWTFNATLEQSKAIANFESYCKLKAQLPKRGEWIEDDKTYAGGGMSNYKCSLCGKIGGTWRRGLKPSELPNWCGNCGADMRKMEVQE